MEKVLKFIRNKKYVAIYLVGVLLLSTGISFAYFTATTKSEGTGGVATATTATVESEGILADGNINVSEENIYPGHKTISSIKVTGTGTQVIDSIFNNASDRSEYVGLKYTINQQHGTDENSTIMSELNDWYYDNLRNYADDIDTDAGFCSDRETRNGYSWTSELGTVHYKSYERLSVNKNPSFKCSNLNSDLFTTNESNQGNKSLKYPIGLITADEVAYAGGVVKEINRWYYLYTIQPYWTMSPSIYGAAIAYMFYVEQSGSLNSTASMNAPIGIRPVINLKANTLFTGSGTSSNPYVVV